MAAHCHGGNTILLLPSCFFKIILKTNLKRIKIPNKFAIRYGGGLPNPVFLNPPYGTKWEVYWSKQNGEVWLEKGWKEFVKHFSLDEGYVVFFTYKGTSQIDVRIHDKSLLEIDYPSCDTCDKKDILDNSDDEWPVQKAEQITEVKATQKFLLNRPRNARAQELATKFMSCNPLCNPFFTIFMKPYNVSRSKLPIPNLEGYIENKMSNVVLQLGKKSWNVKLLGFNYLGRGWHKFVGEIELQQGDVCIFELICRKRAVFKVHVFKSQS